MSTSHDPDTVQSVLSTSVRQLVTCLAGSVCRENIDDDDDDNNNTIAPTTTTTTTTHTTTTTTTLTLSSLSRSSLYYSWSLASRGLVTG